MAQRYGYLTYRLPAGKAQYYADAALAILHDLHEVCPAALPVFLAANSVLTLSGVRHYDAYHEFYGFITDEDREAAAAVLYKHGYLILPSNDESADDWDGRRLFELLHVDGLEALPEQYVLPESDAWPVRMPAVKQIDAIYLTAWSYAAEHAVAQLMSWGMLPESWLQDWWNPMDVRFGMMLGYPAKAIESIMYESVDWVEGAPDGVYVEARVSQADAYYAARPTYLYEKTLMDDPEITAHEALWSGILDAVYGSDWHKRLQDDTIFQEALAKVKRIEEAEESHQESGEA